MKNLKRILQTTALLTLGSLCGSGAAYASGKGGTISINASSNIVLSGPLVAKADGTGTGGELSVNSSGDLTLQSDIDVSADESGTGDGGTIDLYSPGTVTLSDNLIAANGGGSGGGGKAVTTFPIS